MESFLRHTRPVEAVLFDHDGTLVDSLPIVVRATNAVLHECGLPPATARTIVKGMIHPTARRLGLLAGSEDPALASRFAALALEHAGLAVLYPGIASLLEALAGRSLALAVVSNSEGAFIRSVLGRLGVASRFRALVGEDDMPAPKPDPRGLLAALAACGSGLDQALYVGDSAADLLTARAAGMRVIGVTWGSHARAELESLGFDALADTPAELADLF